MSEERSHFFNMDDDQVRAEIKELQGPQRSVFAQEVEKDGNFRRALFIAKSFSCECFSLKDR